MYKKLCTTLLVVTVALSPLCALGQQDSPAAKAKQAEDEALRQKAFELLERLAGEVSTLQSPENRARLGSNIAWSLWPRNENRARQLVALVQQDINMGLQAPEIQDPEDTRTLMVFLKLRADAIERIAKHDPELAYEFFKATGLSSETKVANSVRQSEKALESHLAKQLSASNPDLSLQLGRKMLAKGFSDDLGLLLRRLRRKHKEHATTLYKEIVHKLGDVDLAQDWNVRHFALNLAHSFPPPAADESTFREFVNLFIKALVKNGCTTKLEDEGERSNICRGLSPAIPLIAKVEPSHASKLERWAADAGEYYSRPFVYYELSEFSTDGSVDDMLGLIVQYPEKEFEIRLHAMHKAQGDGDPERARKIVTEYRADPEKQRMMLERLDRSHPRVSINNEELENVQKRLGELHGTLAQVIYLLTVANRVADNDSKTALKLLNQAGEMIDTMKPGKYRTGTQIMLAIAYSYERNNRGLAIMESLMPNLNDLVTSAARLDGFDTRYLRDGEWNMTGEGELGGLLTRLAQNAGYFAWCDFDRAVSVAGQFERPEIRMMAQLKLAQGILAGPPKRLQLNYGGYQH